jgi:hypothetical protein
MSFHSQNIEAFIELLKKERTHQNRKNSQSLFSEQKRAELDKLVSSLPEDNEKISEAIASWYEKHPQILDAQLDILNTLLTNAINATRKTGGSNLNSDAQDDKSYKADLLAAIRQNSTTSSTPKADK